MKKNLLISLFALFVFNYSIAADYYFTGVVNNSWNNAANWTIGFHGSVAADLPSDTDNVYIGDTSANFLIDLSGNCTINNLTLSGNGEINISTSNGKKIFVLGNFSNENNNSNTLIKNAIVFSGASEQLVTGSYEVKIDTLIVNKSNGSVTLTNQLSIYKKLILIDGFINSDTINILTIKSGGKVTNASDSSFIEGPVAKLGNTSFTFPIGRNGIYNPITISAPTSTTDKFVAEYFDTKSNTTNLDSQFTYIDTCQFWRLRHLAGSSNVNVKMNIDNPCFHIPSINYIGVAKDSSGNTDEWVSAGNTTILTPSTDTLIATLTAHSSWGDITLGKTNPLVVAFAGNDTAICFGESVTLGGAPTGKKGTGTLKYKWSPSTGLSNATIANPVATPTETTTYYVVVTDSISEYTKDAVVVIVYPQLVIVAGNDTTICYGSEFNIGGAPTTTNGTVPFNYLWKNIYGDTIFQVANPFIEADSSVLLYLTVTDSFSCVSSDTILLTVQTPIEISLHIDTILYLGQSTQFDPSVSGGLGSLNYAWTPHLWLSDSTIINPVCVPLSSVDYSLIVQDSLGCQQQAFGGIRFRPIDIKFLGEYAAFAQDSILSADSSSSIGDAASRYIETANIHFETGRAETDTNKVNSLDSLLTIIINDINAMVADTISSNLSNDTLTSGIYRIISSATISDTLTLLTKDSASYFVFDIDSNLVIVDSSVINFNGVRFDQVYFSVNGKITAGNGVQGNGIFMSNKKIKFGSVTGIAGIYSNNKIEIETAALNMVATDGIGGCDISFYLPKELVIDRSGYTLVFEDEFNSGSLNSANWILWGPQGNSVYFPGILDPSPVVTDVLNFDAGNIKLLAKKQIPPLNINGGIHPYTAGMIMSNSQFYHGYFEILARQPSQDGLFPAFWLFPHNGCDCHRFREIDFFDNQNYPKTTGTMVEHYKFLNDNNCTNHDFTGQDYCPYDFESDLPINMSQCYLLYSGEWDDNSIKFYLNNHLIATFTNYMALRGVDEVMSLVLNNSVIPSPPSNAGLGSSIPREFSIDYVRVWQKNDKVVDFYFLDDNDYTYKPTVLYGCGDTYQILTSYYQNAISYKWYMNGSSTPVAGATSNYLNFTVSGSGAQSVKCDISMPSIGNQQPDFTATGTYNFTVSSGIPATPIIQHNNVGDPCVYQFCIDAIANGTSYEWKVGATSNSTTTYTTTDLCPPFATFSHNNSYYVKVKAINPCGESSPDISQGTLPYGGACRMEQETKDTTSSFTEPVISIYPSPSNGSITIENNYSEDLKVRISFIDGHYLKTIDLSANSNLQVNNLPQGILFFEFCNTNGIIVKRSLVPVIKP